MARKRRQKETKSTASSEGSTWLVIGLVSVAALIVIVMLARDSGPVADQTPEATAAAPVAGAPAARMPPPPPSFAESEMIVAERIAAEDAMKLLENDQAVMIDVRDVGDFVAGHVPGSLQIPLAFVEGEIPWFPTDKKLITYCT